MATPIVSTPVTIQIIGNTLSAGYGATFTAGLPGVRWYFIYGLVNDPNSPDNTTVLAKRPNGGSGSASSDFAIPTGANVYVWGRITYPPSDTVYLSALPLVVQVDGPVAPGIPTLTAESGNQITVNFQGNPFSGSSQTFSVVYGVNPDPNFVGNTTTPAYLVGGNIWGLGPFNVAANVDNYIFSKVETPGYSTLFSSAPLIFNTGVGPIAPSGPTSTPGVVSATNSSITVSFNLNGVTGSAPLVPTCGASLSATGPFDISCQVQTNDNILYTAVATGLVGSRLYYFQTILSNGTLPNQVSAVAGPFQTSSTPQTNPPFPVDSQATQITMRFNVPPATVITDSRATLLWGALPNAPQLNSVPATYLGLISSQPTWEATVYGLTPGRSYYFQGVYAPLGPSAVVSQATERGNTFDLGYMPPRPWATPNPVIVSGVSQPWRQT